MEETSQPTLWYFADPMCSWCWGFSPVIAEVKKNFANRIKIALVMGGLQPGETNVLPEESREEIFHHWQQVEKASGQNFLYENALAEGFIYNTEPACRAVITVGLIEPGKKFTYLNMIQSAFYANNQNITQIACLQQLAAECGIDAEAFSRLFNDDKQRETTEKNFQFTKKAGVQGFPTLILNIGEQLHDITRGYQNYEKIAAMLEKHLTI